MLKQTKEQLITAAYSAALSPEKYSELLDAFNAVIFVRKKDSFEQRGLNIFSHDQNLISHLKIATNLHDKFGRKSTHKSTAQEIVNNAPCPAIIFDQNERIVTMNTMAEKITGTECKTLPEFCANDQNVERIRNFMFDIDETKILVQSGNLYGNSDHNTCIIVRRVVLEESNHTPTPPASKLQYFFLSSTDLGLDHSKVELLKETYHLTEAETDIAVKLADGEQPIDIAKLRKANVSTIRTQIKSLKQKTNSRDIPAIVRLVLGMSASLFVSKQVSMLANSEAQNLTPFKKYGMIKLRDGRKLSYLEQGDPKGKSIIFIHNMLYGTELPDAATQAAARMGLRILSIYRPGYERSDLHKKARGDKLLNLVAADISELLDQKGISKAIILGQTVGAVYALRFARLFPHRVHKLVAVSYAPIWQEKWLNEFPKYHKLIALLARYTPNLLPFVTRSALARIDQGETIEFINSVNLSHEADQRALQQSEVLAMLEKGLRNSVMQGDKGFHRDLLFNLTDYCEEACGLKTPFHIISGEEDIVIPVSRVKLFAKHVPGTTIEIVKGAGQFAFHSHWQIVLSRLKKISNSLK